MPDIDDVADPYRVLQVAPDAEEIVIHAAYRALARRFHPDGETPDERRMQCLNGAYQILRDPARRRWLDARRVSRTASAQPFVEGRTAAATTPVTRPGADILDFGRYAGWRLRDIARRDPDYLRWLCRHSSGIRYRDAIAALLPREPDLVRPGHAVA